MTTDLHEQLATRMENTRRQTLSIFDLASEDDLRESPGFGFRPILWHLAHIGVFEGYWLLQKLKGEPPPDQRYERIFDPIKTPREESKNLPSRAEMERYLSAVRERVLRDLERTNFADDDPLLRNAYIYDLVHEHEEQHQETLAYLFQLLPPEKKNRPEQTEKFPVINNRAAVLSTEMVRIAGGDLSLGADSTGFVYDNELPRHVVRVAPFKIDRLLTTNSEYAEFVEEGGYNRKEWWSDEGWEWRERENWNKPLYWMEQNGAWSVQRMFDYCVVCPDHPVTGISWYEADAYARFRGKRLPTEAEWEFAAAGSSGQDRKRRFAWGDERPTTKLCNFDFAFWGTTPVGVFPDGASASGCLDMTGNVWEWTSDPFAGFPNFKPYPYPEYSESWFDQDHRVLKGGSWATHSSVLRISFRNFFRRHFRIAFTGIRCATDD